jgi:hypothetical protein
MGDEPGTAPVDPYRGRSYAPVVAAAPQKTLSILSMALSLSSVLVLVVVSAFAVLMAIAGVVLGIIAALREPQGKPFWLTGIIVGGAVTLLGVVGGFLLLAVLAATWFL